MNSHLFALLNALPELLFEVDLDGRIHDYYSSRHDLLPKPPFEFLGKLASEVLPSDAAVTCRRALDEAASQGRSIGCTWQLNLPQGSRWFELSVARMQAIPGNLPRFIAQVRDITNWLPVKAAPAQLHDQSGLIVRIQQLTQEARHDKHLGALLLVGLEGLSRNRDAIPSAMDAGVAQQVARRLKQCVRESDTVAHWDGDTFALLLTHLDSVPEGATAQAEQVASKVLAVLREPFSVAEDTWGATVAIGVTLLNGQSQSEIDGLMKQAELALHEAKRTGPDTVWFCDRQMQDQVRKRVAMEAGLRLALQRQEFELFYQAQVTHENGLVGVEALLRWHRPEQGLVLPGAFIPLAEEAGLIFSIGHWVLQTACRQLVQWAHLPDFAALTVAVNVSALQFQQDNFVQQVREALDSSGANPQRLKLELTESLLVVNVEDTIAKMHALKALGVSFSMDDFGTGYSSLSILKRLPLDQLKIDQSFVHGILTGANDAAIARMIVALAQTMGLSVIAEGVESEAQHQGLLAMGCRSFQGYLFGKPVPVRELEATAFKPG